METPIQLICAAIMEANLTIEDCHTIQNTLRYKREMIRSRAVSTLKYEYGVGTRVETFNLRPKYVNGKQGIITSIKRTRCSVKFDIPMEGRFRGQTELTVPLTHLKIIDKPERMKVQEAAAPLMRFLES